MKLNQPFQVTACLEKYPTLTELREADPIARCLSLSDADWRRPLGEVAFGDYNLDAVVWLWVLTQTTPEDGQQLAVECLIEQPPEKTGTEDDGAVFMVDGVVNCPGNGETIYVIKAKWLPKHLECNLCYSGLENAGLNIDEDFSVSLKLVKEEDDASGQTGEVLGEVAERDQ